MEARDLMTTDVKTLAPDDDVAHALKRLARFDFSGFPVVDDDRFVLGVVTESDFVDLFEPAEKTLWIPIGLPPFVDTLTYQVDVPWEDVDVGIDYVRNAGKPVSEVMSTELITVEPDDDVEVVLEHLRGEPNVNRVPVVDDDGRLVGLIARQDVIRAFHEKRLE